MKTKLPKEITTIEQAKTFLLELHNNNEAFHPEDDANDITGNPFTKDEGDHINKLIEDIYNLEGNNGNHKNPVFDPCKFLIELDPEYVEAMHTNCNVGLDVYTLTDQPTTCPKCGLRPEVFHYLNDGNPYQINVCDNHSPSYVFKTVED